MDRPATGRANTYRHGEAHGEVRQGSSAEHLYHGSSELQRHQLGLAEQELFHLCSAARLLNAYVAV